MLKNPGIYLRVLILGLVIIVIFLCGMLGIFIFKNKEEKKIFETTQQQFEREVNSILHFNLSTLQKLVYDYSYWDDFVTNINENDTAWFNEYISFLLSNNFVHYIRVYDKSFHPVYEISSPDFKVRNFIPKESVIKLYDNRFLNYFVETSQGLLEISSASIHKSSDSSHLLTLPEGYLVLGRYWNENYIDQLSEMSSSKIYIDSDLEKSFARPYYSMYSTFQLFDWQNKPVKKLFFVRDNTALALYSGVTRYMILAFIIAVVLFWLVFHLTTRVWLNKPLRLIMEILKSENLVLIDKLNKAPGEFKDIGNLINNYFSQKAELISAKEKAEESERLKSAFLANMSHEIRTPMNGILGFADLLKSYSLAEETRNEYINIIERSGKRLLNIINDLIDISKVESGQMKINKSDVNINSVLDFLYSFFKPEVENKGMMLAFEKSLDDSEAIINTDKEKLYAILTNLIKNAIKYTNQGKIEFGYMVKDISIETYEAKDKISRFVEFYVKDSGIGIIKAKHNSIFERFVQVENSISGNYEGAGLGLAITQAYVKLLGGSIWLESEPGVGSRFYFNIPFVKADDAKTPVQHIFDEKPFQSNMEKLKILVAEDEETSFGLLKIILSDISREIVRAKNGLEALELCKKIHDFDLILMDIKMPVLDGLDATRHIRKFNKDIYIVAQTAFALEGDKENVMNAGCNAYITKPVDKNELLGLIKKKNS
ncbi:MAG: ATP-binding protein [Bacteroidales bacterium]